MKYIVNWKIGIVIGFSLLVTIIGLLYASFFAPNLNINGEHKQYIYVYPNQSWDDVLVSLHEMDAILCASSFKLAVQLKYASTPPQSGKYDIEPNLSNRYLLNRITHGLQSKIILRLVSARSTEKVASNLSKQLMVDSTSLITHFLDSTLLEKYDLTLANSLCLFVPFSTEITWDVEIDTIMFLIEKEYQTFWNESRLSLAKKIKLSPTEIHTLASIVEEETNDFEDKKTVAGLYINRLRKGMPLQADPTVRYAIGNFEINRILKKHLLVDSPFNTYIYEGLPPSPIRIPSKESINAVLHYTKHSYLFMCAKPDFSGTHDFSRTFQEHMRKARAYQRQLNKRGIF